MADQFGDELADWPERAAKLTMDWFASREQREEDERRALLFAVLYRIIKARGHEGASSRSADVLTRLFIVARAYHHKQVAADYAHGDSGQLPKRPGMPSANAIGTMCCSGYHWPENGRCYIPAEARPQDAGKIWLHRIHKRFGQSPADSGAPEENMNEYLIRHLLACLP